jgi:hypothetical protein
MAAAAAFVVNFQANFHCSFLSFLCSCFPSVPHPANIFAQWKKAQISKRPKQG